MKSQLFDLNGFEKTAQLEPPTIPTSLGPLYCSLRRTLPNDSFHEILGQPDAMFESQSKLDTRIYIWETDQVSAALSIEKVIPKSTSVENKYFVDWRTELKDPSLRLTSRVGFNGSSQGESYVYYANQNKSRRYKVDREASRKWPRLEAN